MVSFSKRACLPQARVWSATGEVNHIRRIVLACERDTWQKFFHWKPQDSRHLSRLLTLPTSAKGPDWFYQGWCIAKAPQRSSFQGTPTKVFEAKQGMTKAPRLFVVFTQDMEDFTAAMDAVNVDLDECPSWDDEKVGSLEVTESPCWWLQFFPLPLIPSQGCALVWMLPTPLSPVASV